MKKDNKALSIGVVAFGVAGVVVLSIGIRMFMKKFIVPDFSEAYSFSFSSLLISVVLCLAGLTCLIVALTVFFKFVRDPKVKGQTVTGVVTGYEKNDGIEVNGACPYRIKGTFVSPISDAQIEFISSNIWETEEWFGKNVSAGDKVDVTVKNDRKYKVDVDSILRHKGIVEL